ncbi:MAG: glycosyltransferase [Bacteroidetes bacterium]|nr:glycosyltransferase [Bacteroidota bacterium]
MLTTIYILSFLILLTYVIYPVTVFALGKGAKPDKLDQNKTDQGRVFLFMSVHNEEAVLCRKLESLVALSGSKQLICYIGSDASIDDSDKIIKEFGEDLNIEFERFENRTGKPGVINFLVERAKREENIGRNDLFLITDANVFPHPDFLQHLSSAFVDPAIGLADGVAMDPAGTGGVADSETSYLKWETSLKWAEGELWGCAMGPFGGAYMIRPELFKPVPSSYLVDDFFIFYHVISQGYKAVVVREAICYEHVSGNLKAEFNRKKRIATGNFQNTFHYFGEIIRLWKVPNLVFVFHKLLRWLSPVFGVVVLVLTGILAFENRNAQMALLIMISLLVGIPLINYLLNQVDLHAKWLQGLSYLIIMNLAMLLGFFNFLKGVKSNVWQPTKRKLPA